jgi:DNA helicase TIP49 (TBP-interacting protein)
MNSNNMKVDELDTNQKTKRINVHTHIKGLGLDENGNAQSIGQGLVGQKDGREVCLFSHHLNINFVGCWYCG